MEFGISLSQSLMASLPLVFVSMTNEAAAAVATSLACYPGLMGISVTGMVPLWSIGLMKDV